MSKPPILVTGGSGFIALLLSQNYPVRTTLRSLSRGPLLLTALTTANCPNLSNLTFTTTDLTSEAGWDDAVKGCIYIHHIASPFPSYAPKDEQELLRPAIDGTLRVLKAAKAARTVKRVILTSSFAAIGYGSIDVPGKVYSEADWTPADDPGVGVYQRSKTMAERAAWSFMERECADGAMELSVVNPVAVFGPVLDAKAPVSTSVSVVQKMLNGQAPAVPQLQFGVVDVRDVAALHVLCMTHPGAAGQRFIATTGQPMWLREVAGVLKERLDAKWAWWVPTREVPNWVVKAAAYVSSMMAMVAGEVGRSKLVDGEKAIRVLGWQPRTREEAVLATAESLIAMGLV